MIVVDTNLLVFAYDATAPRHRDAKRWWEAALSSVEPIGVPWVVVLAFTRLLTHPTICERPVTTETVRGIVASWVDLPHVRLLSPTEETIRTLFSLLEVAGVGGSLSTDAMIAAHAIDHGGIVYSNDRDFGRFAGLRWKNPLE